MKNGILKVCFFLFAFLTVAAVAFSIEAYLEYQAEVARVEATNASPSGVDYLPAFVCGGLAKASALLAAFNGFVTLTLGVCVDWKKQNHKRKKEDRNMKKKEIFWLENGWTVLQDADAEKHVMEISCFSENGNVIEIRKRHNDGEEEILKKKIDCKNALPMTLEAFKAAYLAGEIKLK